MFNSDQKQHMEALGKVPLNDLCWCGWYVRGCCKNGCDPAYSASDKMAVACRECGNAPLRPGEKLIHVNGCLRSNPELSGGAAVRLDDVLGVPPSEDKIMPFVGLEGIKEKEIDGKFVRSPAAAIRALKDNRVASLSGDRGAVTVWRDDAGNLRGDFSRWRVTQDSILAKSKVELRRWLDRVAPQCE